MSFIPYGSRVWKVDPSLVEIRNGMAYWKEGIDVMKVGLVDGVMTLIEDDDGPDEPVIVDSEPSDTR